MCGVTSFFLVFFLALFLDDMQRGDEVGAVNVGIYVTGCGAAGVGRGLDGAALVIRVTFSPI